MNDDRVVRRFPQQPGILRSPTNAGEPWMSAHNLSRQAARVLNHAMPRSSRGHDGYAFALRNDDEIGAECQIFKTGICQFVARGAGFGSTVYSACMPPFRWAPTWQWNIQVPALSGTMSAMIIPIVCSAATSVRMWLIVTHFGVPRLGTPSGPIARQ